MSWQIDGVNYWENPNCPRDQLVDCLVSLIEMVEGVEVEANHFESYSDEKLREEVGRYEYLADK